MQPGVSSNGAAGPGASPALPPPGPESGCADLLFRAGLLRLAGRSLSYPDSESRQEVATLSARLEPLAPDDAWRERLARLRELASASGLEDESEFLALADGPGRWPLHECAYAPDFGSARQLRMADVAAYYHAFGLEVRPDAPERPDHASLELEFLGELLLRQAHANETGNAEQSAICGEAARGFLSMHLGGWLGLAADGICEDARSPYLASAAALARSAAHAELAAFGVTPVWAGRAPSGSKPDEEISCAGPEAERASAAPPPKP